MLGLLLLWAEIGFRGQSSDFWLGVRLLFNGSCGEKQKILAFTPTTWPPKHGAMLNL
jgi:hypothetical protein